MSDLAAPPRPVAISDEAVLWLTLAILNTEAKQLSRRGLCGTRTAEYERAHLLIDGVLTDYELKAQRR